MDAVRVVTIAVLLLVGVTGLLMGGRVLARREVALAPAWVVTGRWAGMVGLLYLGGGLVAGGLALLWLWDGGS